MTPTQKLALHPSSVVLDLVLEWSDKIGQAGTAKVVNGSLMMFMKNHRGEYVGLTTAVHFDGESSDQNPPRFVLRRLGPGVWKLAPSVLDERIHAYITITNVPEPTPWQ